MPQMDQHDPGNEQKRHAEHRQEPGHDFDDLRLAVEQRQQLSSQDLSPNAIETERVESREVIEELLVDSRVVGRDELPGQQNAPDGHGKTEQERDREDQAKHGARLWEKNQEIQNTTLVVKRAAAAR